MTTTLTHRIHTRLRPLPWRRMTWVTWRHHRAALGGVVGLLAVLAVWMWISGLQAHHAYAIALACHPAGSQYCIAKVLKFEASSPGVLKEGIVLLPVPAVIGAFLGPLTLGRELETGSFRYSWTQGFGRARWAIAQLALLAVAVTALTGAFTVLAAWYYGPYLANNTAAQLFSEAPFAPGVFQTRGVAFAAWTLFAFAVGAAAGMLVRRVVPAIVATLVICTALAVGVGLAIHHSAWDIGNQADHFWSLQWIQGGCLLALSVLLIAVTVQLVQRRPA